MIVDETTALLIAAIWHLYEGATLGQCEAIDDVIGEDEEDVHAVRCGNTGVRIVERDPHGHTRLRTVCPRHGYDRERTSPYKETAS